MSAPTPLAGATVVPFDHAAAAAAIGALDALRHDLAALRLGEMQHVTGAHVNWEGTSRRHFDGRRARLLADLDRSISGITAMIDRLESERRRAATLQIEADLAEEHRRALDVERLLEQTGRG